MKDNRIRDYTGADRFRNLNLDEIVFNGVGEYDVPEIMPEQYEPTDFIPFNYAKTYKDRSEKGVHFFIDDYQFDRVWHDPRRYTELLKQYKAVMSPGFSQYIDWPVAIRIYNHYRKHFMAAYWQMNGIKVYPTILWGDKDSFKWCFDGEPVGSCIAVQSMGFLKKPETKPIFMYGYDAMLERLQPTTILIYGKVPKECRGNIIQIQPFSSKFDEIRRKKNGTDRA